jgi:hypothetical protein
MATREEDNTKPKVATRVKSMSKPTQQFRTNELKDATKIINALFEECIDNNVDLAFSPENIDAVVKIAAKMDNEKMLRFVVVQLFEKVRISGFEYMTNIILDSKQKSKPVAKDVPEPPLSESTENIKLGEPTEPSVEPSEIKC